MVAALTFATFRASVEAASTGLPPQFTARPSDTGTGSGLVLVEGPLQPPTVKKLGRECPTFRKMAAEAKTCNGTVWRATLELLRHTTGGEAACHKASRDHPEYDEGTTQERLDRYAGMGLGPPRCATLQAVYGAESPCPSCPHFGNPDTSPIAIARNAPDTPLPPEIPPAPKGFRRSAKGVEAEVVQKGEDGEDESFWAVIYDCDFYPTRIVDDPLTRRKSIEWRAMLPIKGETVVTMPVDAYTDENKMIALLANQGVFVSKPNAKRMGLFVSYYIQQLQKFAAEQQQIANFGWTANYERFVTGEGSWGSDGLKPAVLSPALDNAAAAFKRKGTLGGQTKAMSLYRDPVYVRQQVVVCIAAAAPLFYLTGHYGLLINLCGPSGASKSTALFMAGGIYGIPERYVLNGTVSGATKLARLARLDSLANLPCMLDDVSDMASDDLKSMVMGATQYGGRLSLRQDRTERAVPDHLKSSVMLMTSNPSMHDILSQFSAVGTAGSMRVMEMICDLLTVHTKREADEYKRLIQDNCGHVGERLLDFIMRNRSLCEAMLRDVTDDVERRGAITAPERFWSTAAALAVFGARLLAHLDIVDYDAAHMLRWFVEVQIPFMRSTVRDAYLDPVASLLNYVADNQHHFIQIGYTNGGFFQSEPHRGPIYGRLESSEGKLWISVQSFRNWCQHRKLSYDGIVRDLLGSGLITREKMDLTRYISGPAIGVAATLRINLNHPTIAEKNDELGKVVKFPGRGGAEPLVSQA